MGGLTDKVRVPEAELSFSYSRSSGPGGQNVNKVNSKAQLRWFPAATRALSEDQKQRFFARFGYLLTESGELLIKSDRFRDQRKNRQDCVEKLEAILEKILLPPKKRIATKPTYASQKASRTAKSLHRVKKQNRKKVSLEDL